jgi:hypothetical protein
MGQTMNETTILQNLEAIAEKLDVKVNYENLRKRHVFSKGGFCRLKEDKIVIIDNTLNLSDKIDVLADALSQLDLEDIYMPPAVRKILDRKSNMNTSSDQSHNQQEEAKPEE